MDEFIAELENNHIAELNAYLIATDLKDYNLTDDEKLALKEFENLEWEEFRVGNLFDIKTGSLISTKDLIKGDIPRISVKTTENGITGKFNTRKNTNARHFENFISVNFFGQAFYHLYKASVEMKVHILKLKNLDYTKKSGIFITTSLNKNFKDRFSYGDQLSSSDLKNKDFKIQLPIKDPNLKDDINNIDFKFMQNFIKAIEKLVIKDVVKFSDEKIALTKKICL